MKTKLLLLTGLISLASLKNGVAQPKKQLAVADTSKVDVKIAPARPLIEKDIYTIQKGAI